MLLRLWIGRQLEELVEKHFKEKLPRLLGLSASGPGPGASDATAAATAADATPAGAGAKGKAVGEDELLSGLRGLIFGDFMQPGAGGPAVPLLGCECSSVAA